MQNSDKSEQCKIVNCVVIVPMNKEAELLEELTKELDNYLAARSEDQPDGSCVIVGLVRIFNISKQILENYLKIHRVEQQLPQIYESLVEIIKVAHKIHKLLTKTHQNDFSRGTCQTD